jgi:predicted transcriptional regulator
MAETEAPNFLAMTTDIVAEYAATNSVSSADLVKLIQTTYDALSGLGGAPRGSDGQSDYVPAVSVRKSLANPDFIISLIDGKPYQALKRHLTTHGLTGAEYRERYGLKADYPLVAPSYSERRSALAKAIGLGRKPGQKRRFVRRPPGRNA